MDCKNDALARCRTSALLGLQSRAPASRGSLLKFTGSATQPSSQGAVFDSEAESGVMVVTER